MKDDTIHVDEDATVLAFLDLLAIDISTRPECLQPLSEDTYRYMKALSEARKRQSTDQNKDRTS